ncbi:MAG: DUF481 domain-containing protein, partial [Planctomycetes bacterium]|nr:DUF481 domain-containing protein [Planctomycetota bacterium]
LIHRDWKNDHVEFRGFATYGTSEGEVNRDSQLLGGLWRHFYQPEFYSYASLEMSRDEVQDRSFRGLFNVGAGYILWQESDLELFSIEGGLGYRVEVYSGVTATRHDATARLAALYKDLLFEDVQFTQSAEIIFPVTDVNSFIARSESLLAIPLNEAWAFRFGLRLEWNNDPAAGRDELDVLATTGLEYKF